MVTTWRKLQYLVKNRLHLKAEDIFFCVDEKVCSRPDISLPKGVDVVGSSKEVVVAGVTQYEGKLEADYEDVHMCFQRLGHFLHL